MKKKRLFSPTTCCLFILLLTAAIAGAKTVPATDSAWAGKLYAADSFDEFAKVYRAMGAGEYAKLPPNAKRYARAMVDCRAFRRWVVKTIDAETLKANYRAHTLGEAYALKMRTAKFSSISSVELAKLTGKFNDPLVQLRDEMSATQKTVRQAGLNAPDVDRATRRIGRAALVFAEIRADDVKRRFEEVLKNNVVLERLQSGDSPLQMKKALEKLMEEQGDALNLGCFTTHSSWRGSLGDLAILRRLTPPLIADKAAYVNNYEPLN